MKVFFSDFFGIDSELLENYGAFDVSLINDLPVFVDPFLLFNSANPEYRALHDEMIRYLRFLREMSGSPGVSPGLLKAWYRFPEVRQTWLGYSRVGNSGSGLGARFASALHQSLSSIFTNFGNEQITRGSHLEKLCLVRDGVGRDNISDFTTNLIKGFLCRYTESFATENIDERYLRCVPVTHVVFNYETRTWTTGTFTLPFIDGDYVLLAPKDILTKDDAWISRQGLYANFQGIAESVPNDQLRAQVNEYFLRRLPKDPKHEEFIAAVRSTIEKWPELIDYYIRHREDAGEEAVAISGEHVREVQQLFHKQVGALVAMLKQSTAFYQQGGGTYEEAIARANFLKKVVEEHDGYRLFYVKGKPVQRESDVQVIYRLTWFAADASVDREVNNGRGPVDYKISRGSKDAVVVEFKLASNTKLKQGLTKQVEIYKAANDTDKSVKVILAFSDSEMRRTLSILNELGLAGRKDIVLIDGSRNNKSPASAAA